MNSNKYVNDFFYNVKKLNYKDLIIFLIPFIIFLYYLKVYDPAVLTFDSYYQLHQIATNHFTTWHPFFHTFIVMLCIKFTSNLASVGFLQILTFSSMWMIICKYNRNDTVNSKQFILQVFVTLFISFVPINGIFSITVWKDVLYSYFLMFLCFLIEVILDKKGDVSNIFVLILALTFAFVFHLRSNGMVIVLVLIILAIYFWKHKHNNKYYIVMPALAIIFILLIASLNVVYDVENEQKDFVFDKTAHILSDYDLHLNVSNEDRQKIHNLVSERDIQEHFNPTFTDPTFSDANEDVFDNNKGEYITMVLKYSLNNPLHFLEYMFGASPLVWDITRDKEWSGYPYYVDLENGKKFYNVYNTQPVGGFDNASSKNLGTQEYNDLNLFAESARLNIVSDTLFNSPALYMYLAFIILVILQFILNTKELYLVYLPNLLSIITVFLSIPGQHNRYLYANLLVCYLLIIILIRYYDRFSLLKS